MTTPTDDEGGLPDRFQGLLVGTAVGDSLGLPMEGLSPSRARKLFGSEWRHRFLFGKGMVSDDTEQTLLVAQCLIAHPTSVQEFQRRLAWSLRWWLAAIPAGVGLATLRSILRLWLGMDPERSGVRSAGNGAAMRSAPIGAFFANDPERIDEFAAAAARPTHNDPRAVTGALAVARLAGYATRLRSDQRPDRQAFVDLLRSCGDDEEWGDRVEAIDRAIAKGFSVTELADSLGLSRGVSGHAYHTVPVVAFAWYAHYRDFRASLVSVLECGGDSDTTGAIIGALAGATVGLSGIPPDWIDGIAEWPRDVTFVENVARELANVVATRQGGSPIGWFRPGVLPRNLLFLVTVLAHGFRRLVPPY